MLSIILLEIIGSCTTRNQVTATLEYEYECECGESLVREEPLLIVPLPMANSIETSIQLLCAPEDLGIDNGHFCYVCDQVTNTTLHTRFTKLPEILIFQLKWFCILDSVISKDDRSFMCPPRVIKIDSFADKQAIKQVPYKLVAQICHSGSLKSGHYWANITKNKVWLACDDRSITKIKSSQLNNDSSYVLLFVKQK